MKVFAISDLHLASEANKPMDIFGESWKGHWEKIREDWIKKVSDEDVVLIAGDVSWGMKMSEAENDLREIDCLPGKKVIVKGNHDYWWVTHAKLLTLQLKTISFLHNNALSIGDYVFCGTRGWMVDDRENMSDEDKKIFDREIIRLGMSLSAAKEISEGKEVIGMMHFPPFNGKYESSPFTDLFEKFGVKNVIYGHLHGKQAKNSYEKIYIHNVTYRLTSCDFLQNTLMQL